MTRQNNAALRLTAPGLLALVLGVGAAGVAGAARADEPSSACPVARPAINFNRWNEDWHALASPCVPAAPLDALKYWPLSADGLTYLSLGGNLRERYEINNTPLFGSSAATHADSYLIQRAELHADLRVGPLQFFTQLEDARAFGKNSLGPPDSDKLDVEQAFATLVESSGAETWKARIGRQQMAWDLQRFVAARDGPNVRQSFDALWGDWEHGPWRLIGYASRPVQNRDAGHFDDSSSRHQRFNGVRLEYQGVGPGDVSGYYSRYQRDGARFIDAVGDEQRDVYDLRYSGKIADADKGGATDFDVEGMLQRGHVGSAQVTAWAIGSIAGYTWNRPAWHPRIGLQFDAASGDRHPGDGHLDTFNPLFPNGYYFALAGYTGYANLVHLKPSLSFKPVPALNVMLALAGQWRATTADAIYVQGNGSVPGSAGHGQRWTGAYAQLRTDWLINRNLTAAVEAVHFQVGEGLRQLGGRNGDYLGLELKFSW
jgi:hypothetical protein